MRNTGGWRLAKRLLLAAGLVWIVGARAATPPSGAAKLEPWYAQSWADYMAMRAHAQPMRLPDWSGIWSLPPPRPGAAPFIYGTGDPQRAEPGLELYARSSAKLTPKYKAAYEQKLARIAKGIEWDRLSYCLPVGMPRWLAEPFLREFIPTPTVTWLIHEQISEVRRVYTDGRSHSDPGQTSPLWEGESVGFWDGDTLVVHTAHMKAGEYQRGQPDYSFKTSSVERIRKTGPDTIEDRITIYDPESLLQPYRAVFTYRKHPKTPVEWVNFASCEEGNNAIRTKDGGTSFLLPGDAGYRDPTTLGIPPVAVDSLPQ